MIKSMPENRNLLLFNISKALAFSAFFPFQIYTLFYLSSSFNGKYILGLLMVFTILIVLLSQRVMGSIIDSYSRKHIIKTVLTAWIIIAFPISFLWKYSGIPHIFYIVILFIFLDFTGGMLWDVMRSLQQNITLSKNYGRSNGLAEISGQVPSIIGPAMSIPVLAYAGVGYSFLISTAICIICIVLTAKIQEDFKPEKIKPLSRQSSPLKIIKAYPSEIIFISLLNIPYVLIATGDFLKPIFIVNILHGASSDIALSEIAYSAFASITGLVATLFSKKHELIYCYIFFSIYTVGSFLIPFARTFLLYIALQSFHGIGNPGTRITRNTFTMKRVENKFSGRFNAAVSVVVNSSKLILLMMFTLFINIAGSIELLLISAMISLAAMMLSIFLAKTNSVRKFINNPGYLRPS